MKSLVASALAASVLSGLAMTSAQAGYLTPSERAAIHRSEHRVDVLKARARADGHVSLWERAQVRVAQARHDALVYRYTHN